MSASPVFSSAAMRPPFYFFSAVFSARRPQRRTCAGKEEVCNQGAEILAHVGAISKLAAVVPASRLEVRPAPEMVSSGIPQLDSLTGGLPRGCLTEICGAAVIGKDQRVAFRSGPRYPARRSLCPGGCERCVRSGVSRGCRHGDEPFAVGAMRREMSIA